MTGPVIAGGVTMDQINNLQNQHNQLIRDLFHGEVTAPLADDNGSIITDDQGNVLLASSKIDRLVVKVKE